jgi:hypothetical protein
MEKKNIVLSVSALLGLMFALTLVSALTINTPTASQNINGTFLFNVTTAINNVTNCTWSTTADSSFAFTINATSSQTIFTNSTNTASLTDAEDTTLTVLCRNSTASESATRTISIDNTAPTCSFDISGDHIQRQSGLGITVDGGSTDTTDLTYSYVLTNDGGSTKQTYTTSDPTFSNGDLEDLGEHTITLTVTDEVSKTASCTETFLITGTGNDQDVIPAVVNEQSKSNKLIIYWVVGGSLLLIVLAGAIWIATESSKKKRR